MVRTFGRHTPRIHPSVFVHDSAEVIGRVTIARGASIWPMAVLRGDVDAIRVGENTNIQDQAVLHGRPGWPAVLGRGVTVGHGAIVHGSRIGDLCLVGMGATVMESVIGRECLIAAGSMVLRGMRAPARSLIMGFPAKVVRPLKRAEIAHLRDSRRDYMRLAREHARSSRVVF